MGNFFFLVFIGSCLHGITVAGNVTEGSRSVKIDNCNNDWIDIRKNENNTLVCRGFFPNATITWSIDRNTTTGTSSMDVATCGPSNCTVHQTDHFAVQRLPSQSHTTLFYQQYNTSLDIGANVTCTRTLESQSNAQSCKFNVINTPPKKQLPTKVIVGIILGAVAAIILAVVVIRIVIVKLRRQEPAGRADMPGNHPLEENEDVPNATARNGEAGADGYTEINLPKKGKVAELETESAAKPTQSSMVMDKTQRSAADGDEYNTLSHTRGAAHTQGQAEVESQYDHIDASERTHYLKLF